MLGAGTADKYPSLRRSYTIRQPLDSVLGAPLESVSHSSGGGEAEELVVEERGGGEGRNIWQ